MSAPSKKVLFRQAKAMHNAIDMIEGALMGCGNLLDLQYIFETSRDDLKIRPEMTVGQLRRICKACAECTRIINSPEFVLPPDYEIYRP